jgi:MFS family permease
LVFSLFGGRPTALFPLIGQVWTWQAVFLALGAPGVIVAFLAFAIHEPPRPSRKDTHASFAGELSLGGFVGRRWRVVALVYGGFALTTLVAYAVSGWTPAFLGRTFGWSTERIGATFGAVVVTGGLAGSLLGGWCIDWLHRRGNEDACLIVGAIACALATPLLVGAYWLPRPGLVLLALAFGLAAAQASGPAAYASLRLIAPPHLRGRLTAGFVLAASLFGTGLGPLAVGLATDFIFRDERRVGAALAFVVMTALPAATALLALARRAWQASAPLDVSEAR